MQSTFVDVTIYLQFCFAKLQDYCIIVQRDFELIGGSVAPITMLSTFFLWSNMTYQELQIRFNTGNKNLLFVIYYKTC